MNEFDRIFEQSVDMGGIAFNGLNFEVNVRSSEHNNVMVKGILSSAELEKSVMDELGGRHYGSNPDKAIITITKTGAEVKAKLSVIEGRVNSMIESMRSEQAEILAKLPENKDCVKKDMNRDDYSFRDVGHRIDVVPQEFDDECVWGNKSRAESIMGSGSSRTDEAKLMGSYNSKSSRIARGMSELVFINTIKDNLSDNQKIKLTPSQAAVIGF